MRWINLYQNKCLRLGFIIWLTSFFTGCQHFTEPQVFHCYDERGKPLEGVVFISQYVASTLMSYRTIGVDYRFSDDDGNVCFENNSITKEFPESGMRFVMFVYSNHTHSGDFATGTYVAPGELLPLSPNTGLKYAVYEYAGNLTFQDFSNDPVRWHLALHSLMQETSRVMKKEGHYQSVGIDRLEAMIVSFTEKERALFLEEYGNALVPVAYYEFNKANGFPQIPPEKRAGLRFKDIALPIR